MSLGNQDLTRFCSNCGAKVFIDDKFCGTCGTSRKDALGDFDPKLELQTQADDEFSQIPRIDYPKPKKDQTLKWILGVGAAVIIVVAIAAFSGNSSDNSGQGSVANSSDATTAPTPSDTPTPSPTPSHSAKPTHSAAPVNQCDINNQSITDLVAYKNAVTNVPSGSNDAAHQKAILQWVDSANSIAQAISNDAGSDSGRAASQMQSAADDLTALASLAADWANNSLPDPGSFVSQYNKATTNAQGAYSAIVSTCGSKLPGF